MFVPISGKVIASLVVALGMFLSGAAPAWATPASSNGGMPSMGMMASDASSDGSCMESGGAMKDKQIPRKNSDKSCAICTACVVNFAFVLDVVPEPIFHDHDNGLIGTDVNPDGIASPPALPPPILRA